MARVNRLRTQLLHAPPVADSAALARIEELLTAAAQAVDERNTPTRWWWGTLNERAWLSLHEAEALLIDEVVPDEHLSAVAADVLVSAKKRLSDQDPRVVAVRAAVESQQRPDRPAVAHLARAAWDAADDRYAQSRGFRNRLLLLALLAATATTVLIRAGAALIPAEELPLQPLPGRPIATFLLLALLGGIGALTSSVPSLSRAGGSRNPFSLPLYQLLLKLSLGPMFAIVGVLLLNGGLVPDLTPPTELWRVLMWAFLFGSSQQLLSGLADRRVEAILAPGDKA